MCVSTALDSYPHVFRQAILASDAHRHPFIERLGMMYMMKLKHGDNFGKRSSSTWRLLFVFALMPWLRKYRIVDESEEIKSKNYEGNEVSTLKHRILQLEAMNRSLREGILQKKMKEIQNDEDLSYAENVDDDSLPSVTFSPAPDLPNNNMAGNF